MDISPIVEKIYTTVRSHELALGSYARYTRPGKGALASEPNEYGCADAANILYTIGRFPSDAEERAAFISVLQGFQNPETGLFTEATHHPYHTTAHCAGALELFDARPLYPLSALMEFNSPQGIRGLLESLDWEGAPWGESHKGAGVFSALSTTGMLSRDTKNAYFAWLSSNADPVFGLSRAGAVAAGKCPEAKHLFGWFHYLFTIEHHHMPIPCPDLLIDSCLDMFTRRDLTAKFGEKISFREADWSYSLNRASRQTAHRFGEIKLALIDFAEEFVDFLSCSDTYETDDFDDLHMLFGTVCALAELQQALPGTLESEFPLKSVLDRRPFI